MANVVITNGQPDAAITLTAGTSYTISATSAITGYLDAAFYKKDATATSYSALTGNAFTADNTGTAYLGIAADAANSLALTLTNATSDEIPQFGVYARRTGTEGEPATQYYYGSRKTNSAAIGIAESSLAADFTFPNLPYAAANAPAVDIAIKVPEGLAVSTTNDIANILTQIDADNNIYLYSRTLAAAADAATLYIINVSVNTMLYLNDTNYGRYATIDEGNATPANFMPIASANLTTTP